MAPETVRLPPEKDVSIRGQLSPQNLGAKSDEAPPGSSPAVTSCLPLDEARALARCAIEAVRLEKQVFKGVRHFRGRLRREARVCAAEQLYHWNARGVEWFNATCGWVFLKDDRRGVLYSVGEAAVKTAKREGEISLDDKGSIVAHVCRTGDEYLSNDVAKDQNEGRPYLQIDPNTKSELAAPLYDPASEKVIGVYNLEANRVGAFAMVQARELRRSAAVMGVHALVMRALQRATSSEEMEQAQFSNGELHRRERGHGILADGWVWHPEVHGWSPGRILERFCHLVATELDCKTNARPSCTIWYADERTGYCWALATSGYDYHFINLYSLGPNSAVARAAASDTRVILRGTPETLGFEALRKARQLGVLQVALASLRVAGGERFRGALALYGFDDGTVLPGDSTVCWLAEQAERLINALYTQRVVYGIAQIMSRLGTSAQAQPSFRLFRKALSTVLPNDSASIYARQVRDDKLQRVDTTIFQANRNSGAENQLVLPKDQPQSSINAYCAVRPGVGVRINFGESDPIYADPIYSGLPKPDPKSFEQLDVDEPLRQRRLAIGVSSVESEDSLGVLRLYRSGKKRPFTDADQRLLERVASSYWCCRALFANWRSSQNEHSGLFVASPTPTLLEDVLRKAASYFRKPGTGLRQGSVFVFDKDAKPQYRLYAYFSPTQQLPPDEVLEPLAEHLIGVEGWKHRQNIVTLSSPDKSTLPTERVCIPLTVWSGRYPVEAVCCLDFDGKVSGNLLTRERVFRVGVEAAAVLSANRWSNPPSSDRDDSEKVMAALESYVKTIEFPCDDEPVSAASVTHAEWSPAHDEKSAPACGWKSIPEPSLQAFGVRVQSGGKLCAIPLRLGPFPVAVMLCTLGEGLQKPLGNILRGSCNKRTEAWTYHRLYSLVGLVTGAWCRVVAPNTLLWKVEFPKEPARLADGTALWHQEITASLAVRRKADENDPWRDWRDTGGEGAA
jgi:hypothetical protein